MSSKKKDYQNLELAKSAIVKGKLLIYGTKEWEDREILRFLQGNRVISLPADHYIMELLK